MELARRAGAAGGRIARSFAKKSLILMYHRIADTEMDPWSLCVTPANFEEHLQVLRDTYTVVSVRDLGLALRNRKLVDGTVAISFDDGYADNLQNARPLLDNYELPATIFMTSGKLSDAREFWWDELEQLLFQDRPLPEELTLQLKTGKRTWHTSRHLDSRDIKAIRAWEGAPGSRMALYHAIWESLLPLTNDEQTAVLDQLASLLDSPPALRSSHRTLTAGEIQTLAQDRLIDIGAHTVTHPMLASHSESVQRHEMESNKVQLEELTGIDINCLAYPFGDHNRATAKLALQAGFECACTTVENTVWRYTDPYRIPRLAIEDLGGDEFAKRLHQQLN